MVGSWVPEADTGKGETGRQAGHQALPTSPLWIPFSSCSEDPALKAGLCLPELQTRFLSVYLPQVEVLTGW